MDANLDGLTAEYGQMSEPELMALAREYDSLTDGAQGVLRAEFARRGLEPPLVEEDGDPSSRKLVTVKRYRDLSEAIVARSLLESAGLKVYLYDENVVRMDWMWSNMIGGLRLQVEEKDEKAATEILDAPVPAGFELDDGTEFEQPRCPVCHSTQISFQGENRDAAMTSMVLLGVPLPKGKESWLCDACGARWEETAEE